MPNLKDPLTPKQQQKVIDAAGKMNNYENINPLHLTLFLLRTGAHPSVLANKQKSSLKTTEPDHLQWSRPKKHGGFAITRVIISKELKPWIYDFVLKEFPDYREWYWRFCKILGTKAGVPDLSPMSFRHTFGCNLDDMGFSAYEISQIMNCSLPVALRYSKRSERTIDEKFKKKEW